MKIYSKYSLGVSGFILVLTIAFLYISGTIQKPSWPIYVIGVVNIGIDQVAIDHCDDDGIAHIVCKEYQIVNTEGLRNLDQVVNLRFEFYGLPLLIRAGTGSPIRAIAVIDGA